MKENWERLHPSRRLDQPTLTCLIQSALPGRDVIAFELLRGGLANTNYKIEVSGLHRSLVVRVYERDGSAARKEIEIYRLIDGTVPLPEVLYADTEGRNYERPYVVSEWIEGVTLDDLLKDGRSEDTASAGRATGEALARMGRHTFPRAGFFRTELDVDDSFDVGSSGVLAFIHDALFQAMAGERLGQDLRDRLWDQVDRHARLFRVVDGTASLAHADFNGSNILMRPGSLGWEVAAILDWEFAFSGSPLFDVGNLLRNQERVDAAFESEFSAAFVENGGTLPNEWRKVTRLLDLVNLCTFLNVPEAGPTVVRDTMGLVQNTVDYLEGAED